MTGSMLDDVLAIPDHLRDALWRVDSARLQPVNATGLIVCGMGGSAIGAELAAAGLGDRLLKPLVTVRGYEIPSWATSDWLILCSSYSGGTEETLSCFQRAGSIGAPRIVISTGGPLVAAARSEDVPVVGLPGILQPRAAVAYMFVVAAEVAALAGVGPSLAGEIKGAADFLSSSIEELRVTAEQVSRDMTGSLPVIYGAGPTAPLARRWKTQINENAKVPAFFSELPEADHNEICSWTGAGSAGERIAVAMLRDVELGERESRRFDLTARVINEGESTARILDTVGSTRVARMFWAEMLGDLVSLELAAARNVDPEEVEAIERLKDDLGRPSAPVAGDTESLG